MKFLRSSELGYRGLKRFFFKPPEKKNNIKDFVFHEHPFSLSLT